MTARKLVAEALGTGLLVAAVVGSGIMADRLTDDVALALLANTLATAAALYALISCFGPVSGAQFNPVVTLVFTAKGDIAVPLAAGFVVAQVAGGVLGIIATHAMFDLPLVQISTTLRSGASQWLAEVVATFGLVLIILGAVSGRANVATSVACYIAAAYWFTASTSFANPAVSLARALTDTFAGIRPADLPAFLLAQGVGAALAAALGGWLFPARRLRPKKNPRPVGRGLIGSGIAAPVFAERLKGRPRAAASSGQVSLHGVRLRLVRGLS